ncbi:hypothetical protein G9X43_14605 [Cronobacter turicensis]|uniref:hypothetical protein n=1 Tax=Cronobacter turicensis TaxID=413502 RepID=UPI0014132512|nr:hypothetical protein [Cronobacter turicensis]NHV10344.1 hypothetical protein [Cronobacter turicensis]NHV64117.1 hypothetical protein [Cronobacter turicensis]NHW10533.1 hypothetical protein [Cronobacter turicensis]
MSTDNENNRNTPKNEVVDEKKVKIELGRGLIYLIQQNTGFINICEMFSWFYVSFRYFALTEGDSVYAQDYEGSLSSLFANMGVLPKTLIMGLIPLAFTMVYRISPVQMIVRRALSINSDIETSTVNKRSDIELPKKSKSDLAEMYLNDLVVSSTGLSKGIYSRGSLYLLFGVIFSIVGLVFFYSQVHTSDSTSLISNFKGSTTFINELIYLAPKFGILFFIELISFFFLKQYRVTMDEFRYYEAIKRSREETLAVVKLLAVSSENVDYMAVLDKLKFSSNVGRLENGQTTEILEARKFDKEELDFLAKIAEIVAKK